jgi:hypothetical protein
MIVVGAGAGASNAIRLGRERRSDDRVHGDQWM